MLTRASRKVVRRAPGTLFIRGASKDVVKNADTHLKVAATGKSLPIMYSLVNDLR